MGKGSPSPQRLYSGGTTEGRDKMRQEIESPVLTSTRPDCSGGSAHNFDLDCGALPLRFRTRNRDGESFFGIFTDRRRPV